MMDQSTVHNTPSLNKSIIMNVIKFWLDSSCNFDSSVTNKDQKISVLHYTAKGLQDELMYTDDYTLLTMCTSAYVHLRDCVHQ